MAVKILGIKLDRQARCTAVPGAECSSYLSEYKRRQDIADSIYQKSVRSILNATGSANLNNTLDSPPLQTPVQKADLHAALIASLKEAFTEYMDCKPNPGDMIVLPGNRGLVMPSLENRCLSELYNEIAGSPQAPPHTQSFERLLFFVYKFNRLMKYDTSKNNKPPNGSVVPLEVNIHGRKGICLEFACTLYSLLKKDGFEDVSLISLVSETPPKAHIVVKVGINGKKFFVDPTVNVLNEWLETLNYQYEYTGYKPHPMYIMPDPLKASHRQ